MAQVQLSDFGNWENIAGYPNYQISDKGFVLNKNKMRILKGSFHIDGYPRVKISLDKVRKHFRVHRLVAEAFLDNPNDCKYVDHIDGDRTNNNVENLRWCSNAENQMNKVKSSKNTSGFKGVSLDRSSGKWQVRIKVGGVNRSGGYYSNAIDAAKAYNAKAIELYGAFAKLNHIPEDII